MPPLPPPDRPLRADARRNRDAILIAARAVFAEQGLDAPLDVVALRAGVSRATQHRHFPTRERLIAAIFDDNLEALAQTARETPDPAGAYEATLLATIDLLARDQGFVDVFNHRAVAEATRAQIATRFLAILEGPLTVAQDSGRIRADLELQDSLLLVDMLGAAVGLRGPGRPEQRTRRAVALLLDAIGPTGQRHPLRDA